MAKKRNEISITKLESTIKPETFVIPLLDSNEEPVADITIKPVLSFEEMLEFVADVVDTCFTEETGEYYPELMDFAIRYNVLTKYANFRMPEDPAKRYDLVYRTDAYWTVIDNINITQFNEIKKYISQKVDHMERQSEAVATKQLVELVNKMNSFIGASEQMFGSEEEATDMIRTVLESRIDEEKLVKSVFDNQKERESADSETTNNVIEMLRK